MNLKQRKMDWHKSYSDAVMDIDTMLNDSSPSAAEFIAIAEWIINSTHNPYAYLPSDWAESLNTAEGTARLLYTIHHAMLDDGEISFLKFEPQYRAVGGARRCIRPRSFEISFTEYPEVTLSSWSAVELTPVEFMALIDIHEAERATNIESALQKRTNNV